MSRMGLMSRYEGEKTPRAELAAWVGGLFPRLDFDHRGYRRLWSDGVFFPDVRTPSRLGSASHDSDCTTEGGGWAWFKLSLLN